MTSRRTSGSSSSANGHLDRLLSTLGLYFYADATAPTPSNQDYPGVQCAKDP